MTRALLAAAVCSGVILALPAGAQAAACRGVAAAGHRATTVRINSYVPGCTYGRRVIRTWFGRHLTSRPVKVGPYFWACSRDIGSRTRVSCIAGKNGLITFRLG